MRTFAALCVLLAVVGNVASTAAAEPGPLAPVGIQTVPKGPLNFDQCVRLALMQSPYLTSSSLEIDVRRLDESDSRYGLFPKLSIRTRYYADQPNDSDGDSKPYRLGFVTDSYNPLESYLTLQARKLVTQMAVLGHAQVISIYLHKLGNAFLDLESTERMSAIQDELVAVARQHVAYLKNRLTTGSVSEVEVGPAELDFELAGLDREGIETSRAANVEAIKTLLGLKTHEALELDYSHAGAQVLAGSDAGAVTLESVRESSFELKIQKLKIELQSMAVTLAKVRFLPTLLLGLETSDPLSRNNDGSYFFYFGFDMPVWDGLDRYRNISRQKTLLKQVDIEGQNKEADLDTRWRTAREKLQRARQELKLAENRRSLVQLRKRQVEIAYNQGREPYSAYLAESRSYLEASKIHELKELEYGKAQLALYALSGALSRRYVDPASF